MPWKPLPDVTKKELSELDRTERKKARFLLDENIDPELAEIITRGLRLDAVWAKDIGLGRKSDEALIAAAWDRHRILLTKDRGFLNDKRFPEHRNPGVVVLPDRSIYSDRFVSAISILYRYFARYPRLWEKHKIDLTNPDEIMVRGRDSTGAMRNRKFRITRNEDVEEWFEENEEEWHGESSP